MSNMSYSRFQNTLGDLHDCEDALRDETFEELSESEQRACQRLYLLCKKFIARYEDDMTTPKYKAAH